MKIVIVVAILGNHFTSGSNHNLGAVPNRQMNSDRRNHAKIVLNMFMDFYAFPYVIQNVTYGTRSGW